MIHHRQRLAFSIKPSDDFARIDKVESYADVMEMPILLCEAKILRARLLLDQGESELAGEVLTDAMADARKYDMQLNLNTAMTYYAEVLVNRHDPLQANRLLRFSYALAKKHRNRGAISQIERLLYNLNLPTGSTTT